MDAALFDETWFRLLAGILTGLTLGSFVTMLSYRVPRGISIVKPPSQCPKCHAPLKPWDLVPVVSWFLEGGKCRYCRAPISKRYLVIELVTTLAAAISFILFGFHAQLFIALVGIVSFVTLITINIERNKDA